VRWIKDKIKCYLSLYEAYDRSIEGKAAVDESRLILEEVDHFFTELKESFQQNNERELINRSLHK